MKNGGVQARYVTQAPPKGIVHSSLTRQFSTTVLHRCAHQAKLAKAEHGGMRGERLSTD
ncbi:MAG: hypothetical protein ACRDDA_01295 [Aeromonas sp.]